MLRIIISNSTGWASNTTTDLTCIVKCVPATGLAFLLKGSHLFTNVQYFVGIGLYPGNKADNFKTTVEDAPLYDAPSASI